MLVVSAPPASRWTPRFDMAVAQLVAACSRLESFELHEDRDYEDEMDHHDYGDWVTHVRPTPDDPLFNVSQHNELWTDVVEAAYADYLARCVTLGQEPCDRNRIGDGDLNPLRLLATLGKHVTVFCVRRNHWRSIAMFKFLPALVQRLTTLELGGGTVSANLHHHVDAMAVECLVEAADATATGRLPLRRLVLRHLTFHDCCFARLAACLPELVTLEVDGSNVEINVLNERRINRIACPCDRHETKDRVNGTWFPSLRDLTCVPTRGALTLVKRTCMHLERLTVTSPAHDWILYDATVTRNMVAAAQRLVHLESHIPNASSNGITDAHGRSTLHTLAINLATQSGLLMPVAIEHTQLESLRLFSNSRTLHPRIAAGSQHATHDNDSLQQSCSWAGGSDRSPTIRVEPGWFWIGPRPCSFAFRVLEPLPHDLPTLPPLPLDTHLRRLDLSGLRLTSDDHTDQPLRPTVLLRLLPSLTELATAPVHVECESTDWIARQPDEARALVAFRSLTALCITEPLPPCPESLVTRLVTELHRVDTTPIRRLNLCSEWSPDDGWWSEPLPDVRPTKDEVEALGRDAHKRLLTFGDDMQRRHGMCVTFRYRPQNV
jgi:hypothetical protein